MWMVPPIIMCRQHLLGEHLELHMFASCIKAGKNLKGYLDNGCLEPASIVSRHKELVFEMESRGYSHKTPLDDNIVSSYEVKIDQFASLKLLLERCPKCRENFGKERVCRCMVQSA
jgi:hypothetical protein